jgi:phospholipid/cholesterol/gamma-HCH transport system substrate-binding protein
LAYAGAEAFARAFPWSNYLVKFPSYQSSFEIVTNHVLLTSELTGNLKKAINPEELRSIMQQLNKTLENAAHTLSPQGGLTTTAQRVLSKLEDSIEQLRDMLTRMNQGKGSLGMLINDPVYAEELREVLRNANKFLNKAAGTRFIVDISAAQIPAYEGGRGAFQLGIWPTPTRYYLLGVTIDARGKVNTTTTTTTVGGASTTVETTQVEKSGFQLTGMLGKVFFNRLDGSVGFLHGDGTLRFAFYCGPYGDENRIEIGTDIYVRTAGNTSQFHDRVWGLVRPFSTLYVTGGVDSFRKVGSKLPLYFGAGLAFDDDDIKMLFTFL